MTVVVGLVVVLPLLAAAVVLGFRHRSAVRDVLTLSTMAATTGLAAALLVAVDRDGTVVLRVGGWAPELGIVLVADLFAALILLVAFATILVVELFAIGQRRTPAGADPAVVSPILLVLAGGVGLSILTGDLFTLFVAFELILVASYVLLTHQGREAQIRSGMTYVVINLFASTLFLFGVAIVYAATGTVNMALLAERIPELPAATQVGIGLWFLVVFGTKAAIFPLFSWLPDSYPTAPTTITAVFAGLLTKIGVYVLIRFFTLMELDQLGPLLLVIAGLTMVIGVAGALAQDDVKRILSFHVVSQIGYMIMGLGIFTVAGVAGAVLFLVHQIPVKTVMFLAGGLIEDDQGTSALNKVGGLATSRPVIAVLFALPALSLAGLPPFSGFVAKLALVDAGVAAGDYVIVVVSLVASILTLLSMTKIWVGAFWGEVTPAAVPASSRRSVGVMQTAAGIAVLGTIAVAVLAGVLWPMCEEIAADLLARTPYVTAVLG
ncbi:MAG: proton-conducting transporter membrane subunit [Ilumatobacteraceae bacterium]|jgi:multicomponent Na+:H+ antiporter subunit D